jgi:methanogenic corrinoid protein MtbC1
MLVECDVKGLIRIYEKYRRLTELSSFYDKLLKPVMYSIGDLWEQGKLDVATQHVCSNVTNNLIRSRGQIKQNLTSETRSLSARQKANYITWLVI